MRFCCARVSITPNAVPNPEVQADLGECSLAFIELEVEVRVRLDDAALILEDDAAGDVLRDDVDTEVPGDAGLLALLDYLVVFIVFS